MTDYSDPIDDLTEDDIEPTTPDPDARPYDEGWGETRDDRAPTRVTFDVWPDRIDVRLVDTENDGLTEAVYRITEPASTVAEMTKTLTTLLAATSTLGTVVG